jgi:hypothetical protein
MKIIQVKIQDLDEEVLKHDILDVQDWLQKAIDGKINSVKQRILVDAQQKLFSDPEIQSIPANTDSFLQLYFSRPYYKNREARVAEASARTEQNLQNTPQGDGQ